MTGRDVRRILIQAVYPFAALIIALAFSGCPDPITALEDFPLEVPENIQPETPDSPVLPEPPPAALVTVADSESLKAALENSAVTAVEVGPNVSLTVAGVTVGTGKTLKIPASSMVTIKGLSVPAGGSLGLYSEGGSVSQLALSSLNIGGALSVFAGVSITLNETNQVQGNLDLYGGTLIVNSGGKIVGGEAGKVNIHAGAIVFVNAGDNNFYKGDKSTQINPPVGIFSWNSTMGSWVETLEIYPTTLQEFFDANYSTTYVVKADEISFTGGTVKAANPKGEKILVLNSSLKGTSLTLDPDVKLKLEGSGSLDSGKITLEQDAELEVAQGVTFVANEGKGSRLGAESSISIRGKFYNTMPGWDMDPGSKFEFYAGSTVYERKNFSDSTEFISNREGESIITLKSGHIVLGPNQFGLEGEAVLNGDFTQPWPGSFYVGNGGTLALNKKLTVKPFGSEPYFELAPGAQVSVKDGGSLVVGDSSSSASGLFKYGKLGKNSSIVVEGGGSFKNHIFPNWVHDGTGDSQGAFIFYPRAKIYAPETAFGSSGSTAEKFYIGTEGSPVVTLSAGRIRLTDKTFALESHNGSNTVSPGRATLNENFTLLDSWFVLKNSELTIASGEFIVKNESATVESITRRGEFVTLTKGTIVVGSGALFEIIGPPSFPVGNIKLASLKSGSKIEVHGEFKNRIYPHWDMADTSTVDTNEFVFYSGSKIYKNGDNDEFIGSSNTNPIQLDTNSTIRYGYGKITLKGTATVNQLSALPLWSGFSLIIQENSLLTVNLPSGKGGSGGDFTLEGISTILEGTGASTGKIKYSSSSSP
jgi:hypothetical protein